MCKENHAFPWIGAKHDSLVLNVTLKKCKKNISVEWGHPHPSVLLLMNIEIKFTPPLTSHYRVFSLTWSASMQIYWNKRKCLNKKRVHLPQDWFGTPTWPPFHCFGTPIWPPWRHVKTLYILSPVISLNNCFTFIQSWKEDKSLTSEAYQPVSKFLRGKMTSTTTSNTLYNPHGLWNYV